MKIIAYHSTTPLKAKAILREGFKIPQSIKDSSTDSKIGEFFQCIFFAHNPKYADYGKVVFKVEINGKLLKTHLWNRRGENAFERIRSMITEVKEKGYDGFDFSYDTVGIGIVNPKAVKIIGVYKRN